MTHRRTLLTLLAALPLAACISLGGKPPPTLLSLSAEATVAAGTTQRADETRTISVLVPIVPQSLATLRVPVQATANEIAYLPAAQWVDAPAKLFAALLTETIAARTGRVTVDPRQIALAPGARLSGRLNAFGIDAASANVVVTYDATLIRASGAPPEVRRFEARSSAGTLSGPTAAAALNRAANQVAGEVAEWVGK